MGLVLPSVDMESWVDVAGVVGGEEEDEGEEVIWAMYGKAPGADGAGCNRCLLCSVCMISSRPSTLEPT